MDQAIREPRLPAAPAAVRWVLVAAWMGVIFYMSSRTDSASQSGWLTHQLFGVMGWPPEPTALHWWEHVLRKTAHFTEYAVLATLLAWAMEALTPGRLAASWLVATGYAATDEFHQIFVPNRGPSVWDVALDSTGAATALVLFAIALGILRRR